MFRVSQCVCRAASSAPGGPGEEVHPQQGTSGSRTQRRCGWSTGGGPHGGHGVAGGPREQEGCGGALAWGLGRGEIGLVLPGHTGPECRWTMRVREKQTDKRPQ